ncbi:hypothetical protein KC19_10G190800 [Ceratodon purpureus]|uniref:Uncharacterized protein n=1 Tax=Ceratodon purpureus TaxID=3225 RepID=A0A8T0GUG2_CERPU|nr:hypothetical protein KC19_10G190800 [Ceratodon purpureus]
MDHHHNHVFSMLGMLNLEALTLSTVEVSNHYSSLGVVVIITALNESLKSLYYLIDRIYVSSRALYTIQWIWCRNLGLPVIVVAVRALRWNRGLYV